MVNPKRDVDLSDNSALIAGIIYDGMFVAF